MHEGSETGFFREYSIAVHRLRQKPGFFGIYAQVVRNRVFREYSIAVHRLRQKPGFFGKCVSLFLQNLSATKICGIYITNLGGQDAHPTRV
jgi:hypothetical protein